MKAYVNRIIMKYRSVNHGNHFSISLSLKAINCAVRDANGQTTKSNSSLSERILKSIQQREQATAKQIQIISTYIYRASALR